MDTVTDPMAADFLEHLAAVSRELTALQTMILEIDPRVATVGAPMLPGEDVFTGWLAIHGDDWRALVKRARDNSALGM